MKTIKNKLFLATAILALASCADNNYLGPDGGMESGGGKILFSSNTPQVTRTSSTDAEKLHYQFKVFGVKTVSSVDQRVFATATSGVTPYDVWFVNGSGNSTVSNSNNWEYVGVAGTYGTSSYQVTTSVEQTPKYWDNSASEYNFQAWSDINPSGKVTVSAIDKNTMTIAGTPTQLANFWISDLQTGTPASFTNHVVQFTFRKAATKVRLGIYETVPGYEVRNVIFHYTDGTEKTDNDEAYLDGSFIGSSTSSATFTVTYSGTPKKAVLSTSGGTSNTSFFNFGSFASTTGIGTTSSAPTWANAGYITVLPNTTNVGEMTLKVDYTLYNIGTEESIAVTNQTVKIPAAYMTWKPNFAYTYLFKITDDKLTPITLDAVVAEDADGTQETITTVTDPSITTYSKASAVVTNNEYKKGNDIYVTVEDGATNPALTVGTNAELYSVTIETGALQGITESTVANAITNGAWNATAGTFTVTDAASKKMVVTKSNLLSAIASIPADASPAGAAITINGAKFGPTTAGTYVFRYMKTAPTYDAGTVLAVGTSLHGYYTESSSVYTQCNSADTADGSTTYYKITTPGVYQYKVIIVVD
ncbi:MAG: hypothetical protein K5672_07280 [Bacteroidaceae bacterium]|nr:hypothetical protein [Bacteroidaceae bacterium]